ncbi:hypothetical protein H4R18_005709 [Coemansia javaensis]|uniref:Myb-like domain-containing protein n=1 Tax=Coemansia javaensis TaxID=2761396 RepID=A0A9W8H0R9_9FUNG|nr:hypothetical protein H4R18_005709 [Coemansia javaensis]
MPPVRRSRRLAAATTRTIVEVVIERPAARPPVRSTAEKLAAAAATARSWRARVTECADRAYSAERGRIDWEAVAAELGLPLIGCLHMFDASLSKVQVRALPAAADWSVDDGRAMADFVSDNFGTLAGDVWRLAGVYMNTSEADCLASYRRLSSDGMAVGVCESIQKCREDGMSWGDIHKMFPVYKSASTLRRGWTPAENERIKEIVMQHHAPSYSLPAIDVAMREFPNKPLSQGVQRQHDLGLGVDWTKVSWVVGLSEIKCLELCRFSEGKARWTYDPDMFCQVTADRMEAFIAKHYPPPAAPNFNAVSNYMWIDINDCIRMAQLLRGEFEWTDEARARMIRMREQGMTYKEIARQLSPNLTADKDQIARDILSGTATTTEAALRLDVPNRFVVAMVKRFQSRMYSSVWTDQEVEQLLEYTRTHDPPYSWKTFSALLGTKSPIQCRRKWWFVVRPHA